MTSELIIGVLIEGAVLALILVIVSFLLSRFVADIFGRSLLVMFLFAAAGAYFGFAVMGRDIIAIDRRWILLELLQVIVFGVPALLGLRGSAYWIALGWALHPAWDFLLHYVGPGNSFAPATYAIACISFDLVVAAYVVIVYGLIGARKLGFSRAEPLPAS